MVGPCVCFYMAVMMMLVAIAIAIGGLSTVAV